MLQLICNILTEGSGGFVDFYFGNYGMNPVQCESKHKKNWKAKNENRVLPLESYKNETSKQAEKDTGPESS
jgi:hypothetical protein